MKFEIEYSEYLKLVAEIKTAKLSASDRLKIETEAAYLHFAKYRTEASMAEVRGLLGMAVKASKNASKKPVKQRKVRQIRPAKAELKNPCPGQCGGKNSRFIFPDGKIARLCPSCHKAGKNGQRVPVRLAAPSAADHAAAIVGSSPRKVLTTAAIIGFGLPSVTAKPPRRRKANGPRVFGDKRDAGERRAYMKREEFKRHGVKKYRGERDLA